MASISEAIHQPLSPGPKTRIVLLEPSKSFGAPIRVSLEEQDLPAQVQEKVLGDYEAISYVWGAKSGTKPVICNGSTFYVTPNCLAALRFLRLEDKVRKLWIDAISIDQTNDTERVHQVKLMDVVYSNAKQVIVWLGHKNEEARKFMKLQSLAHQLSKSLGIPLADIAEKILSTDKIPGTSKKPLELKVLKTLFHNSWFKRSWTLQEMAFGRVVLLMYGKAQIPWEMFKLCNSYYLPTNPSKIDCRHIDYCDLVRVSVSYNFRANERRDAPPGHTLPLLIASMRYRRSSEPRDHVYAYLPLLKHLGIEIDEPDYSCDMMELCERTTIQFMRQTRSLVPMEFAGIGSDNLPSWIPNYTSHVDDSMPTLDINQMIHGISNLEYHPSTKSITVTGLRFKSVVTICRKMVPSNWIEKCFTLFDWLRKLFDPRKPLFIDQIYEIPKLQQMITHSASQIEVLNTNLNELCLRRLLYLVSFCFWAIPEDRIGHIAKAVIHLAKDLERRMQKIEQALMKGEPLIPTLLTNFPADGLMAFTFPEMFLNQKLIFFEGGHFGMTGADVELGDQIVLLRGSHQPLVLRAIDEASQRNHWKVVGSAKILGLPEGAWKFLPQGELSPAENRQCFTHKAYQDCQEWTDFYQDSLLNAAVAAGNDKSDINKALELETSEDRISQLKFITKLDKLIDMGQWISDSEEESFTIF